MAMTRRTFLGTAGAGAAMTVWPVGPAPGTGGAMASSAASSGDLFAVVSKHATWAVFDNPSQAFHEAEMIRQSGWVLANPVRCTPQLAQQFQAGNLTGFVELDGWALTSREAEKRGFDLLRQAGDRHAVRRQLLDHHLRQAKRWVEDFDYARADVHHYATSNVDADFICCLNDLKEVPTDCQVFRCSKGLYDALISSLEKDQPRPKISRLTAFHMLQDEHEDRLREDVLYRVAVADLEARRDVVRMKDAKPGSFVAVGKTCGWVFGAGQTAEDALGMAAAAEPYIDDELIAAIASETLVHAVLENGYEVPGFWKKIRGVLRHEVELPSAR